MTEREVELSQDHLERQARCNAERAMEEPIWNASDAGGPSAEIRLEVNVLDAVDGTAIQDHGTGIVFDDLARAFGVLARNGATVPLFALLRYESNRGSNAAAPSPQADSHRRLSAVLQQCVNAKYGTHQRPCRDQA